MPNSFAPPSLTSPLARARSSAAGAPTAQNLSRSYSPGTPSSSITGPSTAGTDALNSFQNALRTRTNQGQAYTSTFLAQVQAKKSAFQQKYALKQAGGGAPTAPTADSGGYNGPMPDLTNTSATDLRSKIVKTAASRLGTPYAWGGGGPGVFASRGTGYGTQNVVGVDCSGLTSWVYSQYGIKLPRTANVQLKTMGYKTSVANARPGDLIGWNRGGHVALYAGNGWLIESPKPGGRVQYRRVPSGTFAVRLSLPGD